ncbi:hypothetical protein MBLNU459_g3153t1 [Dothideomycetes sp. NU459]
MRRAVVVPRLAYRSLSTKGPRGPRGILDKSRTPSRLPSRAPKPTPRPPQDSRHHASQQHDAEQQSNQSTRANSDQPSKVELVSTALAENESPDLVAPVTIPNDPHGILNTSHPAISLLNNSSIVIQRQIEMMNVFLGFEQANRYVIMNGRGETIGYLAEQDHGLGNALARQAFRTHRSFTAHIFDRDEREVLRIHRPFSWISSRIRIYDPASSMDSLSQSEALQGTSIQSAVNQASNAQISSIPLSEMRIIGEAQQQWAPLRRKYNLFSYRPLDPPNDEPSVAKLTSGDVPNTESKALTISSKPEQAIEAGMAQFAHVNEPFLSWDFTLKNADDTTIGSVNRNFGGFAREIFTDTGAYALRMDSASLAQEPRHLISHTAQQGVQQQERAAEAEQAAQQQQQQQQLAMTLDQRAVMLATAVSIDFDYFSRHSSAAGGGLGGFMPIWFPGMGGGAAEGGAAGGAVGAGEAGAAGEGASTAVGNAARGAGAGEGAVAGAGTMAGYEAMQRGRGQDADDASPTNEPFRDAAQSGQDQLPPGQSDEAPWGGQQDPWAEQRPGGDDPWNQPPSSGSSGGGDSGGEGGGFDWGDWF